jgi:GT2 family glycosyltransferase
MPRITVILPVFNGERYVAEAIESILAQTCKDFEFLIVDDASTDQTSAILAGFGDPRIRVLRNDLNLGVARSLNKALRQATGKYIERSHSVLVGSLISAGWSRNKSEFLTCRRCWTRWRRKELISR